MDLIDSLSTLDIGEGDLYISSLAVSPRSRGMGVGFRLLEEARKIAEDAGLERLTLMLHRATGRPSNFTGNSVSESKTKAE